MVPRLKTRLSYSAPPEFLVDKKELDTEKGRVKHG